MIEVKVNVIPQCSDGDIKHWIQFFSEIENVEKVPHDAMQNDILYYLNALKYFKDKSEEMQKAFATIHGIASETFESCNQLELIRLTAVDHLKGESL